MRRRVENRHRWAVILAGGEGMRLRSLTRFVAGDDRPKQFCKLLNGESLLSKTRRRVESNVAAERTLFVLLNSHECFYEQELAGVAEPLRVIQPANRGTLPAVLYSLVRLNRLDPDSVVAFFPSDHHYAHEERFRAGVDQAFREAEINPNAVILLGAEPTFAATDYGWIEASGPAGATEGMLNVARFWEKPSHPEALELLERGCVWNTFVMVGRTRAFLNMIEAGAPEYFDAFRMLSECSAVAASEERTVAEAIYAGIDSADLSKQVLETVPQRLGPQSLGVYRLGNVGWSDLGDPERLLSVVGYPAASEFGAGAPHATDPGHEWAALWRRGVGSHGSASEPALGGDLRSAGAVA